MAFHLASIGGKRDATDKDSRSTAIREVCEESGMRKDIPSKLIKFDKGKYVDWFVLKLVKPNVFTSKINIRELDDV